MVFTGSIGNCFLIEIYSLQRFLIVQKESSCFHRSNRFARRRQQELLMTYQVSRNGQMYGPYTLEDLQRYVASGNVLPTDLAKSETMPEWVHVAEFMGSSGGP